MTLTAQELYRRGRVHLNAGRNAAARRDLTRAAERTDDADLGARIVGSLAALTIRQGDAARAQHMCTEALAREGLSRETSAMLRGQLGLLALERGDLAASIALLDEAIEQIGDVQEHRTPMLVNRSVAHMQAGHLDAARADLDRAADEYAAAGDDIDRAMAVHNAGYASLLAGDLVDALNRMSMARGVMERASAVNGAICDLDRAEVLRDAGLTTEAESALERVARVFGAHRMPQARGEAEVHLARSLLAHDPAAAARTAASAARRFRGIGSDAWAARADAVRIRAQLARGVVDRTGVASPTAHRLPDDAEIGRITAALRGQGLRADATAVDLAVQLHDVSTRRRPLRLPDRAPIDVRLLAHRVRTERALADGREVAARRHAAAGLDELSGWQSAFASLDLQSAVTMHGRPLMMSGLTSAMRSGRPDLLFEWSERARHFAQRISPVRPPRDPDLAADLAELRMLRSEADGDDWLAQPRASALRERVRHRQWRGTGSRGIEEYASLERAQAELDADTAVLAYVWSAERVSCVVVTADDARVVDIPDWPIVRGALRGLRADLDIAASVRSGPMAEIVRRSGEARLAVLGETLVAGPLAATSARRLVITVPGVLNGIPWSMIPHLRDRVFTLPVSATAWMARRAADAPPRAAAFAVGPRVARGEEEAAVAASAWATSTSVTGAEATVAAVTELSGRADVLHIAAHGRHAIDNPMFSGLELADGALFGYDIDLIAPVPRTVVLSACEVGRSSVRWGEEAVGMTRVWLHAGTCTVIAAPVVVADDLACELLGSVHGGLAAGLPPAEALASASARTGIVAPFQCHGAGF